MSDSITYFVLLNGTTRLETSDLKKALRYANKLTQKHKKLVLTCEAINGSFAGLYIPSGKPANKNHKFCGSINSGSAK